MGLRDAIAGGSAGTTRVTDPSDDAHGGHYLAGLLHTSEQLLRHADELRAQLDTDRGVKLRGCRYWALSSPLVLGGQRRVVSASACQWFGYFLTETSGAADLTVTIGDGESEGDDPVGPLVIKAGTTSIVRWQSGVAFSRGLVLTPFAGAGVVTGSIFLR